MAHSNSVGNQGSESSLILAAVNDAIFRSPSLFGRILVIASFLQQDGTLPSATVEELRRLHLEVFKTWQTYPVRQQAADIRIYLNRRDAGAVVRQLVQLGEQAVPEGAQAVERQMFLNDLRMVQVLLSYS